MLETILYTFLGIAFIACLVGLFVSTIGLIKNNNTLKNHLIIANAIYAYETEKIKNDEYNFENLYGYMEDYDETFKRWWDWGYKHILPPEKFEIIKPYINQDIIL